MADDLRSKIEVSIGEDRRKEHPDYGIIVYCDQHFGVKMNLVRSWLSLEYEATSADANPLLYWRCPKPDCIRCYEPTMFGYFWFSGEMGSRISRNPDKQHQGNHPDLPFMYIGKVGESRRYMCPLYKCDEPSSEIAASVGDEEVQIPADPLANLKRAEKQRADEMQVFRSFGSVSGLPIDEGSAENRDPDYPDILCTISGQKYWFELGQIINEEVAAKLNPNRRKQEVGFSYDREKPFVDVVSGKAKKKYVTDGAPVDLILHFDPRLGSAAIVDRLVHEHTALLDSLTATGPFERVWVFDEFTRTIVWPKKV